MQPPDTARLAHEYDDDVVGLDVAVAHYALLQSCAIRLPRRKKHQHPNDLQRAWPPKSNKDYRGR